jgi:cytochrome c oxidase subunit 2
MMKRVILAIALVAVGSTAQAAGDAAKGKTLYGTCAACHGVNAEGNPALNSPALTGLQDWYMVRQLKNFKDGIRGSDPKDVFGAQMRPMAMTLPNDQAMEDVVAYIRSLAD